MLDFRKYRSISLASGSTFGEQPDQVPDLTPLPLSPLSRIDASVPSTKHQLQSWQDSAPISRLIIYLKEHGSASGIKLRKSNDTPRLSFHPGLGLVDVGTERWQIANNAIDLLHAAYRDMKDLMAKGMMIPFYKQNKAGPSRPQQ